MHLVVYPICLVRGFRPFLSLSFRMLVHSFRRAVFATTLSSVAYAQDHLQTRIDSVVRAEMTRQRIPGVAVAIVKNGEVMLAKGYGEANVEHHVPVTAETVFQSGSVGKQF